MSQLEQEKQLREIQNKYNIDVEIVLDHGILYFISEREYEINMEFRGIEKR